MTLLNISDQQKIGTALRAPQVLVSTLSVDTRITQAAQCPIYLGLQIGLHAWKAL